MRHYLLRSPQFSATGFTDVFQVVEADLTTAVDNTVQAITLDQLAIGDVVGNNMILEVRTNANVVASITASVGVTASLLAFIGNSNLLAAGVEYYTQAGTVAPYVATAAIDMLMNFIPGASDNVAEITTGEWLLWCTISRAADRLSIQV